MAILKGFPPAQKFRDAGLKFWDIVRGKSVDELSTDLAFVHENALGIISERHGMNGMRHSVAVDRRFLGWDRVVAALAAGIHKYAVPGSAGPMPSLPGYKSALIR